MPWQHLKVICKGNFKLTGTIRLPVTEITQWNNFCCLIQRILQDILELFKTYTYIYRHLQRNTYFYHKFQKFQISSKKNQRNYINRLSVTVSNTTNNNKHITWNIQFMCSPNISYAWINPLGDIYEYILIFLVFSLNTHFITIRKKWTKLRNTGWPQWTNHFLLFTQLKRCFLYEKIR